MLETWWSCQPTGFYLAVGPDGEALGLSNVLPLRESATPALELLLQQHTGALRADADGTTGVLVGLAVSGDEDPAVHAAILRHTLAVGMTAERVLVSTPWLPYQRLCEQLGMVHQGDTRHDVYRCGRMNRIYLQDFAVEALPSWLGRLGAGGPGAAFDWEQHVRQALSDLHRPGRLAANPLAGLAVTGSGANIAALLRAAVELLGGSGEQADVEAAQALTWRYLHTGAGAAAARTQPGHVLPAAAARRTPGHRDHPSTGGRRRCRVGGVACRPSAGMRRPARHVDFDLFSVEVTGRRHPKSRWWPACPGWVRLWRGWCRGRWCSAGRAGGPGRSRRTRPRWWRGGVG
ncbi:hypothetical protein ACFQY4_14815 [Catellatospora bangladeshensis]|uniref:hypothetical protein n=1 Tax=Catellatospora bangladeshensis TaxID=310355 RepID=UPI003619B316